MTVLAGNDLHRRLREIIPPAFNPLFDPKQLETVSIDLSLTDSLRFYQDHSITCLDPLQDSAGHYQTYQMDEAFPHFVLQPGETVLGATEELLYIPTDLLGLLDGKSSLARLGLNVHSTASMIQPGFKGQITLELSNQHKIPIVLRPQMLIAQIRFHQLSTTVSEYKGQYQHQHGPQL